MTWCRTLTPLAIVMALSGCNSGGASISGSASETSGSSTGLSSLWERVKSLSLETGKTYEMPAIGIMADAFMGDFAKREIPLNGVPQIVLYRRNGAIPRFDDAVAMMVEPTRQDMASKGAAEVGKMTPLDADHTVYAGPIVVAMQSRKGWEVNAMDDRHVDPQFDTPFFRANRPASTYDPELHRRYMEMLAASAIYTDTVFGMIDKELGTSRLSDPDAARRQVLSAFQAIPVATLRSALRDAVAQVANGQFTTDLANSGNIHFTHSPAGDFVGDPRGMTWTRAGGVWFGDGRIDGQSVSLRLASTASMSQRQAQSGNQGTNADAKVDGAGNVGPGK